MDSLVQVVPVSTDHRAGIPVDECTHQQELKCAPGIVPYLDFEIEWEELPPELVPLSLLRTRMPEETELEVYSDRPFFELEVSMFCITCSVGTSFVLSRHEQDGIRRTVTYVSVLDVYERYGLSITLALLIEQVRNTRRGALSTFYLAIYLIGSVAAMEEDVSHFITMLASDAHTAWCELASIQYLNALLLRDTLFSVSCSTETEVWYTRLFILHAVT